MVETLVPNNTRRSGRATGPIFAALCTVVALAPLPFGSARPLPWSVMEVVVGLVLIVHLLAKGPDIGRSGPDLVVPFALGLVIVGYVFIQVAQWSPAAWWNPLWELARSALGKEPFGAIAVDRQAAITDLTGLLCYVAVFYIALSFGQDRQHARWAMRTVVISGTAYALYGLAAYWSGSQTILWFRKWAYVDDVTGPFVNHNSFATYLGLCTLAALAQVITMFDKVRFRGPRRSRVSQAIEFASQRWATLLAPFILVTALLLTHSRGGFLATVGGTVALLLSVASSPSLGRSRRIGWVALPIAMLLVAFFISGGATLDRLMDSEADAQGRLDVYRLTLQAIGDYPFQGSGLGSFASIFPVYRTTAIQSYYDMAHNDYLQTLLELGIPVGLCLFGIIVSLVITCMRGIRIRQRDAIFPCLGIAASVLVALHATVDFSLQIPAVTVTFAFLLGVAVAQSRSSRDAPS